MNENTEHLLNEILEFIKKSTEKTIDPYQSDNTVELNIAVAKASSEFPLIYPNRENVFTGILFSDLDEVMKAVRPILAKNGLHISVQEKEEMSGTALLVTRLWHSSGQWIETRSRIDTVRNDLDSWASYTMKKKRFQIMELLNLTIEDDKYDDDGEAITQNSRKVAASGNRLSALYRKKKGSSRYISKDQYDTLMEMLDDLPGYVKDIQESLNISTLRNMPESLYFPTVERINNEVDKRKRM